jgi:hypothetical protein
MPVDCCRHPTVATKMAPRGVAERRQAAAGATHLLANLQIAGAAKWARTVELLGSL